MNDFKNLSGTPCQSATDPWGSPYPILRITVLDNSSSSSSCVYSVFLLHQSQTWCSSSVTWLQVGAVYSVCVCVLSAGFIVQWNKAWRGVNDDGWRLLSGLWSSLLALSLHHQPVNPGEQRLSVCLSQLQHTAFKFMLTRNTLTAGWKVSRRLIPDLTEACRCLKVVCV